MLYHYILAILWGSNLEYLKGKNNKLRISFHDGERKIFLKNCNLLSYAIIFGQLSFLS